MYYSVIHAHVLPELN